MMVTSYSCTIKTNSCNQNKLEHTIKITNNQKTTYKTNHAIDHYHTDEIRTNKTTNQPVKQITRLEPACTVQKTWQVSSWKNVGQKGTLKNLYINHTWVSCLLQKMLQLNRKYLSQNFKKKSPNIFTTTCKHNKKKTKDPV